MTASERTIRARWFTLQYEGEDIRMVSVLDESTGRWTDTDFMTACALADRFNASLVFDADSELTAPPPQ